MIHLRQPLARTDQEEVHVAQATLFLSVMRQRLVHGGLLGGGPSRVIGGQETLLVRRIVLWRREFQRADPVGPAEIAADPPVGQRFCPLILWRANPRPGRVDGRFVCLVDDLLAILRSRALAGKMGNDRVIAQQVVKRNPRRRFTPEKSANYLPRSVHDLESNPSSKAIAIRVRRDRRPEDYTAQSGEPWPVLCAV